MRLSLRFLLPLALVLAGLAYAVIPLVDTLTLKWFVRDLESRSELIGRMVEAPLVDLLATDSKVKLHNYFYRILQDERLFAIGFCDRDGKLAYKTLTMSPQHWLAWQTGVSPERAKQLVHIARRSVELPVSYTAFTDGELSIDQMAVVATRAPALNDREACDLARNATVAQLRVGLSKHFFPPAPKPAPAPGQRPAPEPSHRLTVGFNDTGEFSIHGVTDAVDGALINNALTEAKDALFQAGDTDATWLDALLEICSRSTATITSVSRRDNYKIIIHLDTEGAWLHQGPTLPPALFERICCDAQVQPLWSTNGYPINMGRTHHIVPLRTRIVIENRDRICRHPTCTSTRHLEVHHIQHWTHGGPTDTHNLCCLCPTHHDAHHRREFSITGNANSPTGLTFHNTHGHTIQPCAPPQPPGDDPPPQPRHPYTHPTGETLHTKWIEYTQPPPPTTN